MWNRHSNSPEGRVNLLQLVMSLEVPHSDPFTDDVWKELMPGMPKTWLESLDAHKRRNLGALNGASGLDEG